MKILDELKKIWEYTPPENNMMEYNYEMGYKKGLIEMFCILFLTFIAYKMYHLLLW